MNGCYGCKWYQYDEDAGYICQFECDDDNSKTPCKIENPGMFYRLVKSVQIDGHDRYVEDEFYELFKTKYSAYEWARIYNREFRRVAPNIHIDFEVVEFEPTFENILYMQSYILERERRFYEPDESSNVVELIEEEK